MRYKNSFYLILSLFLLQSANAALPIYPAEIIGRDLSVPRLGWIGHVGITTAPYLNQDAYQVIEVLNEQPVIQTNSIALFKTKSPYWGSRYGISDRGDNATRILREANFQKDLMCATYTATPNYMMGKGYYSPLGKAIATSCGYFRCDTFVNYLFHWGNYTLPTYNPPGINDAVTTLPKLVFHAFPSGNEDGPHSMKLKPSTQNTTKETINTLSGQHLYESPIEEFISIIDNANKDDVSLLLPLAQDKTFDDDKRTYLFDTLGFTLDINAISSLLVSYQSEANFSVKKQLLATIQNIRQRLINSNNEPYNKKLLIEFYTNLLYQNLPSDEKEMVIRGFITLSSSQDVILHAEKINSELNTCHMNPRITLGLKLELLHKNFQLEAVLIPDIINFLRMENNVELDEVFNVYLTSRLIYTGVNSIKPESKIQINNYLNSLRIKYDLKHTQSINDQMSILSYGAWLEVLALTSSSSLESSGKYITNFLRTLSQENQKNYILGLSNHQYLTRAFNAMPELMQPKNLFNEQSTLGA
jgi:hypothetical protein